MLTTFDKILGWNIRVIMARKKISQKSLALSMGVHQSAVSRMITGKRSISAYELMLISSILSESESYILDRVREEFLYGFED